MPCASNLHLVCQSNLTYAHRWRWTFRACILHEILTALWIFLQEQVQHNRFLSPRALREHIKTIEEKCATALQEPTEALDLQESSSDSKHERIQLWWAGKELAMDHKLCDYIGINEKTKIVIKLTRARDDRWLCFCPFSAITVLVTSWILYGSCPCKIIFDFHEHPSSSSVLTVNKYK